MQVWVRLSSLFHSERGQTLAEYGLIVTVVAVGVTVLAMIAFRNELIIGYNLMSGCLNGSC